MPIRIHTATRTKLKLEADIHTYMYKVENTTVTTILRATRKMFKICTNHNSDPHEYRLGQHKKEITLKINRK